MINFHAIAVIVSLSTLSHLGVAAADPLPTETFKVLPLPLAVEAAEAAIASCKAQGYSVTAAIVDRAGNLKVLLVGEGANALTRELTPRKAYTAAVRRITTIEMAKAIATPGAFNPTLYDTHMVIAGGGVRSRPATRSSAASELAARRAATRTKPVPMRGSPR